MSVPGSVDSSTRLRQEHDRATRRLLNNAAQASDPARRQELLQEAILLNQPMAQALARQFQRRGLDSEDLMQVAMLGLVKAIHGYRPGHDVAFAAYAVPTIRGEVKRYFRDRGWLIRPPRGLQELSYTVRVAEADLTQSLQRTPTSTEVAHHLRVDPKAVEEARSAAMCYQGLSLDGPVGGSGQPPCDLVADPDDPFEMVDSLLALRPALDALQDRERTILRLRFVENLNQEQIGARIGVGQMQVSRLLATILAKLRASIQDPRAA